MNLRKIHIFIIKLYGKFNQEFKAGVSAKTTCCNSSYRILSIYRDFCRKLNPKEKKWQDSTQTVRQNWTYGRNLLSWRAGSY
jgi:hypothetical protein